jgi:aspartyl-tRNA(Asn)/glutamyl-tRNA(Gln) amidotransferase subunit C
VSVTVDDVKHVARLARLGMTDEHAEQLVAELNRILDYMTVLGRVETRGVEPASGVGAAGMPLRIDSGPPIPLARPPESIAPSMRDGFFLVPRLASHEDLGEDA